MIPTQPAKGIRLAAPTKKLGDYEFSAQKQIGVKSSATGLPERTDDRAIEAVIQKFLQGAALTVAEEKVLRNNINEIPYSGDGAFRPSITERSSISRNATDLFFSEFSECTCNKKYLEIYNGTGGNVDLSNYIICLLYTSPSPRDLSTSRMPSSA